MIYKTSGRFIYNYWKGLILKKKIENTARLAVHGSKLYFKANDKIYAIDRTIPKNEQKLQPMIDPKEINYGSSLLNTVSARGEFFL